MRPEIEIINGRVWATSMDVAEKFDKNHFHVIRDIANLIDENKLEELNASKFGGIRPIDLADLRQFYRVNFEPTSYTDVRGRDQKGYRMTRDGFTMLVFGFEGILARIWKMRYIEKFNAMEAYLRRKHYQERTLTDVQISELVRVALDQARADFTLTFAMNLMMARNLNIPPITRDQMIRSITTGEIDGFKRDRQWFVYQDSFAEWLNRRKKL